MSNYNGQPNQRAGQSVHCYQSVWMTRLTQTSGSSSPPRGQNGLSLSLMSNGDAKKFTEITDMRTIRIMNESVAMTERLDCRPFPLFNAYQKIGSKNGLDNFPHGQVLKPQFDLKTENNGFRTVRQINSVLEMASNGSGSREHVFENISQCAEEPTTQMIPYRSNKGKAPQISFLGRHEKESKASMIYATHNRNHDLQKNSTMGHDKNWDDHWSSEQFGISFLNASFAGEPSKKMQNMPRSELFSDRITSVKGKKSVNLSHRGGIIQRIPGSMLESNTMEIFNANSVDGLAGGRNLLYIENKSNNKNMQKRGIEKPMVSMNSNRNMFSQLLSLSPPLGLGRKGVEIQLLDSSSDSQGKHDIKEILNSGDCQNNESSAETATMDMETFKDRYNHSGVKSSTSNKTLSVGHDTPSQATNASTRKKVEFKRPRTTLPDMNEIPVLPVSSSSMDNAEPSTSETQSLDAEHLHSHSEQTLNHKTSQFPNCPPTVRSITTLELSNRWLKRLKLSVPDSCSVGTKSLNVEESLSHRKVNKLFSKVTGGNKTCSSDQAFSNKYDGKDETLANQSAIVPKKDLDILLSHSWIKRWCRAATQKKKHETIVVCEPQSTKMDFGDLQNKQFPSIGAMALMGKALNGFQPCEFPKKGPFVVWNSKGP